MADPLYSIAKWDERYENSRTRTMQKMRWVPVPNSHDGDGYCVVMDRKDGTEVLGAWVLILQVASKCEPRGTLVQSHGKPHTAETIARQTRGCKSSIDKALTLLSQAPVGWLSVAYQEGDRQLTMEENGTERKERKKAPVGADDVPDPYWLAEAWNATCGEAGMPRVEPALSQTRARRIAAAIRASGGTKDEWTAALRACAATPHWCGANGWTGTFDAFFDSKHRDRWLDKGRHSGRTHNPVPDGFETWDEFLLDQREKTGWDDDRLRRHYGLA